MKTLYEVIAELEDEGLFADALHYLKAFAAKRKVLEYKEKHYDEIVESMLKKGQEREACCQAEIARYQEAVRNCEAAELKYRQLTKELRNTSQELRNTSQELRKNLAEVRNEDQRYPNILFRPDGMYCCVCGSRLDQDREEDADGGI